MINGGYCEMGAALTFPAPLLAELFAVLFAAMATN